MIEIPPGCREALRENLRKNGEFLVLTGAGISAESGIPTFRGPEGYWTVGQVNYRPEELATQSSFSRQPEDIWGWYLYRRGVCARAEPNAAHLSLALLERTRLRRAVHEASWTDQSRVGNRRSLDRILIVDLPAEG